MDITISLFDKSPDWWDEEVKNNHGVFCGTSYWISFIEKLNLGNGKYIEVKEDGKRVLLVLIYDILLGGTLLLFLPPIVLRFLLFIPFLRSYNLHLQPVILDKKLQTDQKRLSIISKKVLEYIFKLAEKEKRNIIPADYICFTDFSDAKALQRQFSSQTELIATARLAL